MLLNNVVIMKSNTYMKKYYEDKGYNVGKRGNIYRYNKLKSYDLKMIEFISHTDKFPNDDILIQMKNEFIHILEENDYIFGIVYNLDTDEINFKE